MSVSQRTISMTPQDTMYYSVEAKTSGYRNLNLE